MEDAYEGMLEQMSLDELKNLRTRWYLRAIEDGSIKRIGLVVRELGTSHAQKHGNTWSWARDGVEIFWDDWGRGLTVRTGGSLVCSTSGGSELFVPGPWRDVVDRAAQEAEALLQARHESNVERERQHLLGMLRGGRS